LDTHLRSTLDGERAPTIRIIAFFGLFIRYAWGRWILGPALHPVHPGPTPAPGGMIFAPRAFEVGDTIQVGAIRLDRNAFLQPVESEATMSIVSASNPESSPASRANNRETPGERGVNTHVLMFGAWAALLYPALLIIGWWLMAGFVPPPPPRTPSQEIVGYFQEHAVLIRAGMVVAMFGALMAMPLGAAVAYFIRRIEGFVGPLTMLQVMGAVGMAVLTFYPPMWWLIAVFRADRSPEELTRMLNDAAWLQWVGGLTIYYPTIITMAIAAFIDRGPVRAFPRWFGYVNLWLVILLLPGQMIFFFKTGPLAWNGLLAFYLAFIAFGLWFPVAFTVLRRAVLRVRAEQDLDRVGCDAVPPSRS
jgi:hypothetical protein